MKTKAWIVLLGILLAGGIACAVLFLVDSPDGMQPAPEATFAPEETPAPEATESPVRVTEYPPTCTSAGYTLYEDPLTGTTRVKDGEPALGHDFSENGSVRVCRVCGYEEPAALESAIARIDLRGDMTGIGKNQRIPLEFDFVDEDRSFSCFSYTTWQGHSSLAYPKKNYTIRLYVDAEITEKNRLHFGEWQLEHKYILKANYMDVTQSRNLIAARLWGAMAATRENLSPRLANTSNFGAVDGFPVTVWLNGEFHGLYTMNLHKDEDLYGMDAPEHSAVVIANAQTMEESLFRAPGAFEEDVSDWELEYCGTEDGAWAKESFNALIAFVMNSDDETFRSELSSYPDVESAVDYLLFLYATGLEENAAKDLVLIKYEDTPWIATVYDMETAFGLAADGSSLKEVGDFLPSQKDGIWSSNTGSLLWDRLLRNFMPEICARWQTLRQGALAQDALIAQAEALLGSVPAQAIEMDIALYPERVVIEEAGEQILAYIRQRLPLLDGVFADGIQ